MHAIMSIARCHHISLGSLVILIAFTCHMITASHLLGPTQESRCLSCIRNVTTLLGLDTNKRCEGYYCGQFQLSYTYWAEAGKPGNNQSNRDYERCARDRSCSEQAVKNYFKKFKRDCNNDGIIDCLDMAAVHKGGPTSCASDWFYKSRYWQAFNKTLCMTNRELMSDEQKSDQSFDDLQDGQRQPTKLMKNQTLTSECLDCICEAISGCNTSVNNCGSGTVCGPFAISQSYWKDGRRPGASWTACTRTKECSSVTMKNYMEKYKKDCNNDGYVTCEDYAAIHRRGPRACTNKDLLKDHYWNKFLACRASQRPVKDVNLVKVNESPEDQNLLASRGEQGTLSIIQSTNSPPISSMIPRDQTDVEPFSNQMQTSMSLPSSQTTITSTTALPTILSSSHETKLDTSQIPFHELLPTTLSNNENDRRHDRRPPVEDNYHNHNHPHHRQQYPMATSQSSHFVGETTRPLPLEDSSTSQQDSKQSEQVPPNFLPLDKTETQPEEVDYSTPDFPFSVQSGQGAQTSSSFDKVAIGIMGSPDFSKSYPPLPDLVAASGKQTETSPATGQHSSERPRLHPGTSNRQHGRQPLVNHKSHGSNNLVSDSNKIQNTEQPTKATGINPVTFKGSGDSLAAKQKPLASPVLDLPEAPSMASLFENGLNESSRIASECLECICDASSNCDTTVQCISKQREKNRCGLYMISWNQYQESDILLTPTASSSTEDSDKEKLYYECTTDRSCAERLIHLYIEKHQRDCNNDGKIDCYDIAAIHRVGPDNCNSGKFLGSQYWKDFNNCYATDQITTTIQPAQTNQT